MPISSVFPGIRAGTPVAMRDAGVVRMVKITIAASWLCCAVQVGCAVGMNAAPDEPTNVGMARLDDPDGNGDERCVATFDMRGEPCELCIDGAGVVTVNSCMAAPPDELIVVPPEVEPAPGRSTPPEDDEPEATPEPPQSEDPPEPMPTPVVDRAALCAADPMAFGGATLVGVLDEWLRVVGVNAGLTAPSAAELTGLDGPNGVSNCFDVIRYAIEHYGDGSFTAFLDPSAIIDCVAAGSCRMIQVVDLGAVQACLRVPVGCNQLQAGRGIAAAETYALDSLCSSDRPWECIGSPLVLDLGSDGLALKAPGDGARFSIAGGAPMDVGWLRGNDDDALLAIDLDGSGCIEGGHELFGEATGERDGFAALARYDDNHDGRVDAEDGVFPSLLLWHDDGDARCDPWEVAPASAHGLDAISLHAEPWKEVDPFGNELGLLSRALVRGASVPVVDVWFRMVAR